MTETQAQEAKSQPESKIEPQIEPDSDAGHFSAHAEEHHTGQRLDRFLSEALPTFSRTRVQALIRAGDVRLKGGLKDDPKGGETIEDVKYRVKPGDCFTLQIPPPKDPQLAAEAIPLDIVYEDDALIVIDKPAGLVVHPGAGQPDGTLVNALIAHCGDSLSGIGGVARPGIVHRLDKDTSGLIVVAKTDQAHRSLADQFADHGRTGQMARGYLALVWGGPSRPKGRIEAAIGRHPTIRTKMAVLPEAKGRHAATRWRVGETYGASDGGANVRSAPVASLIECTLETGRTHQVRVHMAHFGHPLIGDQLYGSGFKSKARTLPADLNEALQDLDRQALHAAHLAFVHPVNGTLLKFNSLLPTQLARIVGKFKQL